jgi:hypothetical protein
MLVQAVLHTGDDSLELVNCALDRRFRCVATKRGDLLSDDALDRFGKSRGRLFGRLGIRCIYLAELPQDGFHGLSLLVHGPHHAQQSLTIRKI